MWHEVLTTALRDFGFKSLMTEPCIFTFDAQDGQKTVIDVHIVDIRIIGDKNLVEQALTAKGIETTDEGTITEHLGIEYVHTDGGIFVHQTKATLKILQEYGYEPGKVDPSDVPLPESVHHKTSFQTGVGRLSKLNVASLRGALLWLWRCSRPDLTTALAKFSVVPDDTEHRFELEHRAHYLLRYLSGTVGLGIFFPCDAGNELELWVDASHASEQERLSRQGFILTLGKVPMAWHSSIIDGKAKTKRSTGHAEVAAANKGATDALFMKNVIRELHFDVPLQGTVIHEDCAAAISNMLHGPVSKSSKAWELELFWLTEQVKIGEFTVRKVATGEQLADLFTKPLSAPAFWKHASKIVQYAPGSKRKVGPRKKKVTFGPVVEIEQN